MTEQQLIEDHTDRENITLGGVLLPVEDLRTAVIRRSDFCVVMHGLRPVLDDLSEPVVAYFEKGFLYEDVGRFDVSVPDTDLYKTNDSL